VLPPRFSACFIWILPSFQVRGCQNKSRVQYCVELFTVGQSYHTSPRTSILALLFAAATSFSSNKSAECGNYSSNESYLVRAMRTLRWLVLQWVQNSSGERKRGLDQGGNDRSQILKSVELEAQTVTETAKMRVRVHCMGVCWRSCGWMANDRLFCVCKFLFLCMRSNLLCSVGCVGANACAHLNHESCPVSRVHVRLIVWIAYPHYMIV
jgi:hypothetical protein